MMKALIKIKEELLDILLPKKCVGCGREGQYICKDCEIFLSEVEPMLGNPISQISGSQEIGFHGIISVWEYEGLIEKAIWKIKFDGCYDIINELMEKAFEKIELNLPLDTCITYVPMYGKREWRRNFNQAELIARKVGEKTGRPVVKFLEKIKNNRTQVGLNPKERLENVCDVFVAVPMTGAEPPSVLLVDDVYTTGATMNECVKTLRRAGIKNIYGFTLARKFRI